MSRLGNVVSLIQINIQKENAGATHKSRHAG